MAVKNYEQYTVTEHAKKRILTRFNITNKEFDEWLARLLSQCTYLETQDNKRMRYRLNDIIVVIDPKQHTVVTVYSQNENEIDISSAPTNPEIQTVIKEALNDYMNKTKVSLAVKLQESIQQAYDANQRMINPYSNYRYTNKSWDEFCKAYETITSIVESGKSLLNEAESKIKQG